MEIILFIIVEVTSATLSSNKVPSFFFSAANIPYYTRLTSTKKMAQKVTQLSHTPARWNCKLTSKRSCGLYPFLSAYGTIRTHRLLCWRHLPGAIASSSKIVAPTPAFLRELEYLFSSVAAPRGCSQRQFEELANSVYPLQIYNGGVVQK